MLDESLPNLDSSRDVPFGNEIAREEYLVDIVVDVDAPGLEPTYTYITDMVNGTILPVGTAVQVSFGGRDVVGYVVSMKAANISDIPSAKLKRVKAVFTEVPAFSEEQYELAKWISQRYICRLIEAVRCIAPSALSSRLTTAASLAPNLQDLHSLSLSVPQAHIILTLGKLGGTVELDQLIKACSLPAFNSVYPALVRKKLIVESRSIDRPRVIGKFIRAVQPVEDYKTVERVSSAGKRILDCLSMLYSQKKDPVPVDLLLEISNASSVALKTLEKRGAVALVSLEQARRPGQSDASRTTAPILTLGQRAATRWISNSLDRNLAPLDNPVSNNQDSRTALLFGVTASGKTEVYLDAIARNMEMGRGSLMLLPEIALTAQVVDIFVRRFGGKVAILHSRLSDGERHDEWRRLQRGDALIAVGARSAAFAPVSSLGLVIVDEEHEPSYKQESQPRYHTRCVIRERARINGATVILGSATPSIETYHESETGKISRLEMPERIDSRPLPTTTIVDMREELRTNRSLFSSRMIEELSSRLSLGQQSILFLNRRGYSQFVLCRDCGYSAKCPNCAVSLTFHATEGKLKCHHCGYDCSVPSKCPDCSGTNVRGFGVGTEKVEEEVLKHLTTARIIRMDRDTTSRKGDHESILRRFRNREADILIGTQMVAKGLDFPNVTFVGVVSADTSINVPDFRASERTFQLMTQVSGRAGRGELPGNVVIQTFTPEHAGLVAATRNDYVGFYKSEIAFRNELFYPPFARLVNVIVSDESESACSHKAELIFRQFKRTMASDVQILGPNAAPLSRIKNMYRWHIVLKFKVDADVSGMIQRSISELSILDRRIVVIDIDPSSLA